MKLITVLISILFIHLNFRAQTAGYFGKRNFVEAGVGITIPIIANFIHNATNDGYSSVKLIPSFKVSVGRITAENIAIGLQLSHCTINLTGDFYGLYNYTPDQQNPSNTDGLLAIFNGAYAYQRSLSKFIFFREKAIKSKTLPLSLSYTIGVGGFYATATKFDVTSLSGQLYPSGEQIINPVATDLSSIDRQRKSSFGIIFQLGWKFKIPVTKSVLFVISTNLDAPIFNSSKSLQDMKSTNELNYLVSKINGNTPWSQFGSFNLGFSYMF